VLVFNRIVNAADKVDYPWESRREQTASLLACRREAGYSRARPSLKAQRAALLKPGV